jgi:DNA-directed RNA polymerase specialized sigma subunit
MMMTAKEYLQQIRKLDIQIRNKKKELEVIQNQMTGVSSISYEKKEPTTSKSTLSPQEKYYPKYEKYSKSILADIAELVELKQKAIRLIDSIDDADCIDVLYKRYVSCLSWKEIAREMNFNYSHIFRIHDNAIEKLNEKMRLNETL